jgi:hypothetical protein
MEQEDLPEDHQIIKVVQLVQVGILKELQVLLAAELDKPLIKVVLEALTKPHAVTGQAAIMAVLVVVVVLVCAPITKRLVAAAAVILVVVVLDAELVPEVVAEAITLELLLVKD